MILQGDCWWMNGGVGGLGQKQKGESWRKSILYPGE